MLLIYTWSRYSAAITSDQTMFGKNIFYITLGLQFYVILVKCSCEMWSTCAECIKDPEVCVWCAMDEMNSTQSQVRCRPQSGVENHWCPKSLQNPENSRVPSSDKAFNSTAGFVVQIKPQSYKIKLRPGKPLDFNFTFQAVKDFPVDLYFLLDASNTMLDIKNETATQSKNIYLTLKNMTSDVTLGLGTFVDKRLYPFTSTFNSDETYSFKHRLKLTKDFMKFEEVVTNNPNGVNRDIPEGGLDALAQAMTCKEVVGWRNESRKIIVFLTDAPYHVAGDGRSAGLFQPYDGKCYTNNDTYTNEHVMDYPSVGMINKLASERDIIIIFLVKEAVNEVYKELSSAVRGSHLTNYHHREDISKQDIVQVLEDVYKKITKKIKFKVNNRSGKRKNFEISFTPNCTTDDSVNDCNVEIEKEQNFNATIKLLRYDNLANNEIDIIVEGFSEKLTLDIEFIKNCECESHSAESPHCFGEVQECGICKCGENRYGERCRCEKNGTNPINDKSTCIAQGSNVTCSGLGFCNCGTCACRAGYAGKFCECTNSGCKLDEKGYACNNQGNCVCGTCVCKDGWTGDACQCPSSTDDCLADRNVNNTCNHRGRCVCGACECDPIGLWDVRREHDTHCKMLPCTDCHNLQCSVLKKCVVCKFQDEKCSLDFCPENINSSLVGILPENYLNSTEWKLCSDTRVKFGCYTRFVYRYNDEDYGIDIVVQEELNCGENYLIYGGICLGTLLVVGLCTLVAWKLLTEARDRREFEEFTKIYGDECDDGLSQHCNPLYEPPRIDVSNPMFRKPSVDVRVR